MKRASAAGVACAVVGLACQAPAWASRDELQALIEALPAGTAAEVLAVSPELCVVVREAGYVIKKDRRGATHFLLLPLASLSGVEDPALRRAEARHYFAQAWAHRGLVAAAAGVALRDEQLGIVVNPRRSRSQDHLHLHINQILPALASQLAAHGPKRDGRWETMVWSDRVLHAIRIPQARFDGVNPFRLLDEVAAQGIELEAAMLLMTAGTDDAGEPVFYLMAGRYGEAARGGWDFEDLMVHQLPGAARGETAADMPGSSAT